MVEMRDRLDGLVGSVELPYAFPQPKHGSTAQLSVMNASQPS